MPNIERRSGTTCRSSLPVACRGWDYSRCTVRWLENRKAFRNRLFVELDDNAAAVFSVAKGKLPTYILSCFAPLAMLMAHYALLAAKIILWRCGLMAGLTSLLASLALLPHLWSPLGTNEHTGVANLRAIKSFVPGLFFRYGHFFGWYTLTNVEKTWPFAALCPLGLALLVGFSIPDRVMEGKHPQFLSR